MKQKRILQNLAIILGIGIASFITWYIWPHHRAKETNKNFTLTSSSFKNNGAMPAIHAHTEFGSGAQNISPELSWRDAPTATKSYALIFHDPDAVGGPFIHWILFNIPVTITELPEAFSHERVLSVGIQGLNDDQQIGYYGPNPPKGSGTHRYTFTLYALDTFLSLHEANATADALTCAMKGHILNTAVLVGIVKAQKIDQKTTTHVKSHG